MCNSLAKNLNGVCCGEFKNLVSCFHRQHFKALHCLIANAQLTFFVLEKKEHSHCDIYLVSTVAVTHAQKHHLLRKLYWHAIIISINMEFVCGICRWSANNQPVFQWSLVLELHSSGERCLWMCALNWQAKESKHKLFVTASQVLLWRVGLKPVAMGLMSNTRMIQ